MSVDPFRVMWAMVTAGFALFMLVVVYPEIAAI